MERVLINTDTILRFHGQKMGLRHGRGIGAPLLKVPKTAGKICGQ
jgi:hypothetical protein